MFSEMIKYGGDAMVDAKLFQIIYHFEVVSREWKLGSICPIFKQGEKQDLGNVALNCSSKLGIHCLNVLRFKN